MSDTHGQLFDLKEAQQANADVLIHCGDLTEESKTDEFRTTLDLLRQISAPLKLVISGNHDLTLDEPTFKQRLSEATQIIEPELVTKNFGSPGEPRRLFEKAKDAGIVLLDEGNHAFALGNGALLKVYASPFTCSRGGWAFQYAPGEKHDFAIADDTQVVITHGPPHGIMDYADSGSRRRAGCPQLFEAIHRARPLLHCFGHIHEGWGAKLVAWRHPLPVNESEQQAPSHFTHIDNDKSVVIEKLSNLTKGRFDDVDTAKAKAERAHTYARKGYCSASHCSDDAHPLIPGSQTLFVNASIEGRNDDLPIQPPWIIDIELPSTT
ncbi:Metallo-dependent phosphatase-like protein [Apiospora rasikravindrae]|uniref:Metallo-dependent phosphatase-like protein n=1 Tax=Apiospora rasikravindrae TaxID=990691 RepID=A0ABR1T5V4_9PEZI